MVHKAKIYWYGIGQKATPFGGGCKIGEMKAKGIKEAKEKASQLPMYDYRGGEATAWRIKEV